VGVKMDSVPLWVTLLGFAAPLLAIAGSAVAFVVKQFQDARERRRSQFFELMQYIDSDAPIATKVAAVYELRRFPEHKDFVIRFCEGQREIVSGGGAQLLVDEMDHTRDAMRALP
jgi:hypothetical protein